MKHDVVVIGAGLAGLTAARVLQNSGLDAIVLEASNGPGGRVKSEKYEGYILDHGFQVINPGYPEVVASKVLNHLEFHSLPAGFRVVDGQVQKRITFTTALGAPGSLDEKIAFLKFLTGKASHKESFEDSVQKYKSFYNDALKPFLTGVFLTDPGLISADAAQKILRSFIKGRPGIPADGVGQFSDALATFVKNISYGVTVEGIKNNSVKTDKGEYSADFIILATDPWSAHKIFDEYTPPQALTSTTWYHSVESLPHNSDLLTVQKNGVVVNSIAISRFANNYAPNGKTLLSTTTLRPASEKDVVTELASLWDIETNEFSFLKKFEIPQSLPLHGVGTPLYTKYRLRENLYFAGDHMTYPSQQGAMESGRIAAEEIIRRALPKRS
jgi:phytoene dehydrogenase-like protein